MVRLLGQRIIMVVLLVLTSWVVFQSYRAYKMAFHPDEMSAPAMTLLQPEERIPFRVDMPLSDLQGRLVRVADLRGQPVLLNIWAVWCPPCRTEMPSLNALYKDYEVKGLAIVAIATDAGGRSVVAPFVQTYGLTFPILLDPQNLVSAQLQVPGSPMLGLPLPTTYLLDKRGRIAALPEYGARDWNTPQIRRLLDHMLAEDSGGTTP